MDLSPHGVRATAGSLRATDGVVLQQAWTDQGVAAAPVTTGAQVLHLSVALCVLNDAYREAQHLGIDLLGICVEADGGFDGEWRSIGIEYSIALDADAPDEDLEGCAPSSMRSPRSPGPSGPARW
jgi:hypothetical protein